MTSPEKLNIVTQDQWSKNVADRNKTSSIKVTLQDVE